MSGRILLLCVSALIHFNSAQYSTETVSPTPTVTEYPYIETGTGPTPDYHLLPSYEECGRNGSPDRIVGGEKCSLDEFPWTVLLQYRYNNMGYHDFLCGGSLISKRYVLTAAHCVKGQVSRLGPLVSVRMGEYDISKMIDCVTSQGCNAGKTIDVDVEKIIYHKNWQPTNKSHPSDIALIRLAKDVEFNQFVKPVCLPNRGNTFEIGQKLWVVGWGRTKIGKQSDIKLKVKVPVVTTDGCQISYQRMDSTVQLNDSNQFCAGGEAGKDSCAGDSGGPAMRIHIDEQTGKKVHIQDGIVSFGPTPCGTKGVPGVYTKVLPHLDWILNILEP